MQSPFIWESSPTLRPDGSRQDADTVCSLPSFGSHLQHIRLKDDSSYWHVVCSLPSFGSHLQPPMPRKLKTHSKPVCSLPSFGSHLQPWAGKRRTSMGARCAVSLHLGVISNLSPKVVTRSAVPVCSLPSFGSHLQREPRNPLMCNDFVPSFATASRYLPPVLSETPYRRRALLP